MGTITNEKMISAATSRSINKENLKNTETAREDLRGLLVHSEKPLMQSDIIENVERLENWVESYRRGLYAAKKISEQGVATLRETREQLALALDELQRLEDEGGNTADKLQNLKVEEISRAIARVDRLIPIFEKSFQTVAEH